MGCFMGQLVEEAIDGLTDAGALRENSNDSIWIAGDLLSRFHSNNGFKSGFSHIDAEVVTTEDAERLRQALLHALDECTNPATKGSILWALKNTYDPNLIPMYVSQLEDALRLIEGSCSVINSCLACLSNLGEEVYEKDEDGSTSQSPMEIEKNWRQARKYIEGLNPTMLMPFPFDRKYSKGD